MKKKSAESRNPEIIYDVTLNSNQEFLTDYIALLKSVCLAKLGRSDGQHEEQDQTHAGLSGKAKRTVPTNPDPELIGEYHKKTELFRARVDETLRLGEVKLPLAHLVEKYKLSEFEEAALVAILAYTADNSFEQLCDEVTACGRMSVKALLRLLCSAEEETRANRDIFFPSGRLCRNSLMILGSWKGWSSLSEEDFLSMTPEVPLWIANYVMGKGCTELPRGPLLLIDPSDSIDDRSLPDETLKCIQTAVEFEKALNSRMHASDQYAKLPTIILLYGAPGTGKRRAARIIAARLGRKLLRINASSFNVFGHADLEEVYCHLDLAELYDAIPCFTLADSLFEDDQDYGVSQYFSEAFAKFCGTIILTVNDLPKLNGRLMKNVICAIPVPLPTIDQRIAIIRETIPAETPLAIDLDLRWIAERFELSTPMLRRIVENACIKAGTRQEPERTLGTADFFPTTEAARWSSSVPPEKASEVTTPTTRLEDVVLSEVLHGQVRQIITAASVRDIVFKQWGFGDACRTGQGISVLFYGPSGTGKTLMAEAIAHELGRPMRVILLSGMMDKWVGETEKHTAEVFRTASVRREVLVFDEADALFAARVDGSHHGSYHINSHINTLLREMDVFNGVVILTTNRFPAMDRAFDRRIRWRLEFPAPDARTQEMLWRKLLPGKAPIDENVNFNSLACEFDMTGGLIRSAVLKAAFAAATEGSPISMRHLREAAATELVHTDDGTRRPIGFNAPVR